MEVVDLGRLQPREPVWKTYRFFIHNQVQNLNVPDLVIFIQIQFSQICFLCVLLYSIYKYLMCP